MGSAVRRQNEKRRKQQSGTLFGEESMIETRIRTAERADLARITEIVAEENGVVMGYAATTRFRPKAAYETTAETSIYCAPEAVGKGLGKRLYGELFAMLKGEDIHRFVAVYVLPNAATEALHRRFGFRVVGVFSENGWTFGKYWDVCWAERAAGH
jgi:phosphinothricin acetyltransferase